MDIYMRNLLLLLISMSPFFVQAQEDKDEMETDRPSQTLTPKTVVKNRFQFEGGIQKQYDRSNDLQTEQYLYPTALLKYGFTANLELRVLIEDEGDYEHIPDKHKVASGIKPLVVGIKYNLLKEKGALPNTSIIARAALPKVASEDFKGDYLAPGIRLAMQNTLSKKVSLVYNAAAQWDPDDVHAKYIVTLCPQIKLTDKLQTFVELYSFYSSEETADYRCDAGFLFKIKPNVQVDISGGLGISKSSPDSFIEAGLSFRLPY
jgi:hypothetical protein